MIKIIIYSFCKRYFANMASINTEITNTRNSNIKKKSLESFFIKIFPNSEASIRNAGRKLSAARKTTTPVKNENLMGGGGSGKIRKSIFRAHYSLA